MMRQKVVRGGPAGSAVKAERLAPAGRRGTSRAATRVVVQGGVAPRRGSRGEAERALATARTRTSALSPFKAGHNPWENLGVGQQGKLGEWYLNIVKGPLRYVPMILIQVAFIPLLYSYLIFPYLASAGLNVPQMFSTLFARVFGALPLSPEVGLAVKSGASWLLQLPQNASNELIWRVLLQAVLPLLPVIYFLGVVPLVDIFMGRFANKRAGNANGGAAASRPRSQGEDVGEYRVVLWTFSILYATILFMSAAVAPTLPVVHVLSICLGLGFYGSVLFAVSHELIHSRFRSDRILSKLNLTLQCYPWYEQSHKLIHHVRVATPSDPSSGMKGQSVYGFMARSVFENIALLLKMDQISRLTKASWVLGPTLLAGFFLGALGPKALLTFLGASLVAILMLEIVQYIEHYGLERKRLDNGKYEPVTTAHSWNADWLFTNCHVINLQLHGDHHLNAKTPFNELENKTKGPQLCAPYPVLILLALVPPLWFWIMDRRLDEFEQQQGKQAAA